MMDILEEYRAAQYEEVWCLHNLDRTSGEREWAEKAEAARRQVIGIELRLREALDDPMYRQRLVLERIADALDVLASQVRYEATEEYHSELENLAYWQGPLGDTSPDHIAENIATHQERIAELKAAYPWLGAAK